jgi:signal peptidase I
MNNGIEPSSDLTEVKSYEITEDLNIKSSVKFKNFEDETLWIRHTQKNGETHSSFIQISTDGSIYKIPHPLINKNLLTENEIPQPAQSPQRVRNAIKTNITTRNWKIVDRVAFTLLSIAFILSMLGIIQFKTVLSGSMRPHINVGDVIVGISTKWVEPHVGDVATYHVSDLRGHKVTYWVHRIIGGNGTTGFIFKGDANPLPDLGRPKLADVQNVVLFHIPRMGKILNPVSALFFIAGISMFVIVLRKVK